jgi:FkbM family methyltransferase
MSILKSAIQGMLAPLGYEIRKIPTTLQMDARWGLNVFELVMNDLLKQHQAQDLVLLQVGANDGVDQDPVRKILEAHPIRSYLCEPLPDVYDKLVKNYQGFSHATPVRCAVGARSEPLTLYRLAQGKTNWNDQLVASFDRKNVEPYAAAAGLPPSAIVAEQVPCFSVADFMAEQKLQRIDIAAIDTEGMDHLICTQLLDLPQLPTVIHFEYANNPLPAIQALLKKMESKGYLFVRSGIDITAVKSAN